MVCIIPLINQPVSPEILENQTPHIHHCPVFTTNVSLSMTLIHEGIGVIKQDVYLLARVLISNILVLRS